MAQPKPQQKIAAMSLTTRSTADGDECVRRKPSVIRESRGNADVIRLVNDNQPGADKDITVFLDAGDASNLFDPVPPSQTVLKPGESVDWTVRAVIAGVASVNFRTEPGNCSGHDQGDIEVRC